jgi:hypothetical protein
MLGIFSELVIAMHRTNNLKSIRHQLSFLKETFKGSEEEKEDVGSYL